MQQSLALAPYQSQWRVVIIPDFQNATIAASNALLKSLEEPPSRAILILTADARENLLETIASRCGILRLRPLSVQNCAQVLQNTLQLSDEEAQRLAHLSGGRVGTAMRYAQDESQLDQYEDALHSYWTSWPKANAPVCICGTPSKGKGTKRQIAAFY